MVFKHILDLVSVFQNKGGKYCITCPGSRNAPLSIYFNENEKLKTLSITDERSAAFFGLGLAKRTNSIVALTCTSGTAALNFSPGVAEAFYQNTPLLVLTADRPAEWIDQKDGQSIHQRDIYQGFIKKSFSFPVNPENEDELSHCNRIINNAINLANAEPKGPVHINIPFREPFYPTAEELESIVFPKKPRLINETHAQHIFSLKEWNELGKGMSRRPRVMLVAGMFLNDRELKKELNKIPFPMITDVTSNLRIGKNCISKHDSILMRDDEDLIPDLVISFGGAVVSKALKTFLRKHKPKEHWHIQESGEVADVFQSLTKIIRTTPKTFFTQIADYDFSFQDKEYLVQWKSKDRSASSKLAKLFNENKDSLTEFSAMNVLLKSIYAKSVLHLANSMTIRYASILGLPKLVSVHSNRGTCGIDGSTSTAIGYGFDDDRINTLITGDVSFLYDRNAFWHSNVSKNLRIIVLNNSGGGIFKLIDGPSHQKEVGRLFVTHQFSDASNVANEFGLRYQVINNIEGLESTLVEFFEDSDKAKIIEIKTDVDKNGEFFEKYKEIMTHE